MGLLSIFKRQGAGAADQAGAVSATAPDAVAAARSRARQRLIGASLLLAVGVLGFPLLFETQPRPISVDIPIEIPHKDRAPPLGMAPAPATSVGLGHTAPAEPQAPIEQVERATEQGREVAPAQPGAGGTATAPESVAEGAGRTAAAAAAAGVVAAAPASKPAVRSEPRPEPRSEPRPEARPAAAASKPVSDAARAQALLEGKTSPASTATQAAAAEVRAVVQVGAFSDPVKLREARSRVEALGLKTYTQVVEVNGERRTRVRVGPFASRGEADKAAARIKAAGLTAAILTL